MLSDTSKLDTSGNFFLAIPVPRQLYSVVKYFLHIKLTQPNVHFMPKVTNLSYNDEKFKIFDFIPEGVLHLLKGPVMAK